MIVDFVKSRLLVFVILTLTISCSNNLTQIPLFSDGFQDMTPGNIGRIDSVKNVAYFTGRPAGNGNWTVATSLREKGFDEAWQIRIEGGASYLAQTFTNLDDRYKPLSLITHPMITAGDTLWKDYTLEAVFSPQGKFDKCGVVFRYKNPANFYFFGIEGNTVILKMIQQSVVPLRPIERILKMQPLVWTPGDTFRAVVTVRKNEVNCFLNDTISLYASDLAYKSGMVGLLSDLPAKFHSVNVMVLNGEQRRLNRKRRQVAQQQLIHLGDHPEIVRWKSFKTTGYGTDQNIRLGDLTGDGNKEILFVQSPERISAMNLDGELLWQLGHTVGSGHINRDELPVQIHDLDGDGRREIILFHDGRIRVLDGMSGNITIERSIESPLKFNSMVFGDLLGVGRDNCIILTDRQSGIIALNEKLDLLWERELETGCQPMLYDIDNDQKQEVLIGYSVLDDQGDLLFDVGAYIGGKCNGVSVYELLDAGENRPCLIYAAGDWGLVYFDFEGNLLKQRTLGHVGYMSIADFDAEREGMEIVTSNHWGSEGLMHMLDAFGNVYQSFYSLHGMSRCLPVNWKGDGEEFFITNTDSINGGMYDGKDQLSVKFPDDQHPVLCYNACDLTGDPRDEILVWNRDELWIYTQGDNPRMGNTYQPHRIPLYNQSIFQMNRSLTGW